MSGYEVEHGIKEEEKPTHSRIPDLSTFFSTLRQVDSSGEETPHYNAHATPTPDQVAATFRLLANAYQIVEQEHRGAAGGGEEALVHTMIEILMRNADDPPTEVKGVPDSFIDELERVPKTQLKPSDNCPICNNPFLEDEYPLVVELPCHKDHRFDLECIRPWLKLNPTCPLDRKDLLKKKEPPAPPTQDEEEEYDDMYA